MEVRQVVRVVARLEGFSRDVDGRGRLRKFAWVFLIAPGIELFMEIRALFFASYKEILGTEELRVDLPSGATVADFLEELRSRGGAFTVLPEIPAVAVNMAYSDPSLALSDGDEVALIPPVAGG